MSVSFKIAPPSRPPSSASGSAPSTNRQQQQRRGGTGRASRHDDDNDSDSDDDVNDGLSQLKGRKTGKDELVTGFDSTGAQTKHKDKKQAPLVIPSLPNRDWRRAAELSKQARVRSAQQRHHGQIYVPEQSLSNSMRMATGTSSGAGQDLNRDVINSEPIKGGLSVRERLAETAQEGEGMDSESEETRRAVEHIQIASSSAESTPPPPPVPETEEQKALRELMNGAGAQADASSVPKVDVILSAADTRGMGEQEAFQRDVEELPDEASLEDYARVPVGEFGTAMLRGMGWKPGQAVTKNGRSGPVEAYVPKPRPSMLGIGAKPMSQDLVEKGKDGKAVRTSKREEMKFMPLVKRERESTSATASASASASGRSTPAVEDARRSGTPSTSRSYEDEDEYRRRRERQDRDRDRDRDSSYRSSGDRRDRDRDDSSYRSSSRRDDDRRRDDYSRRYEDRDGNSRSSRGGSSSKRDERDRGYDSSGRDSRRDRHRSRSPSRR
ncbi:hypothetical protein ACM66B_006492 [Microbotryomycetes sp. NB124-2]